MASETGVTSVAILGCGFMGTALLQGWLEHGQQQSLQFFLSVTSKESLHRLTSEVETFANRSKVLAIRSGHAGFVETSQSAEIIIVACPPDQLESLLSIPGLVKELLGKIIISLLAGVSYSKLQTTFTNMAKKEGIDETDWPIARIIPSLGAKFGQSVSMIVDTELDPKDKILDTQDEERINALFAAIGKIHHIPERLINKATALGAVCHALTILATDTTADASAADGLPRSMALRLAADCFASCGDLLNAGMSCEQAKIAMAVPNGITINAFLDLDKAARSNISASVRNAIAYAEKMA